MTEFVFIRHGETEHTKARIVVGVTDSELTTTGYEETAKAIVALRDKQQFDLCITSGMKRTKAIGNAFTIVYGKEFPVFHDRRLREKDNGVCELVSWEHINTAGFNRFYDDNLDPWKMPVPGGESHQDVWQRIKPALFHWAAMYQDKTILVASHADILRVIKGLKATVNGDSDLTSLLVSTTLHPSAEQLVQPIPHFATERVFLNIQHLKDLSSF